MRTLPCVVQSNLDWTYFILGGVCAPCAFDNSMRFCLCFRIGTIPQLHLALPNNSFLFCALETFSSQEKEKKRQRKEVRLQGQRIKWANLWKQLLQTSTKQHLWLGTGTFVGQASVLWKLLIPDPYLIYFLFTCKCVWVYMPTQARRRHQIPLDLKLQVAGTCPVWMAGTKLGSTRRAEFPFNC